VRTDDHGLDSVRDRVVLVLDLRRDPKFWPGRERTLERATVTAQLAPERFTKTAARRAIPLKVLPADRLGDPR
jgi:hypothetical protein